MRALVAITVVALMAVAASGTAGAKTGDQRVAKAAVLTQADVPSGFTGGPAGSYTPADVTSAPAACAPMQAADTAVASAPNARSAFQPESTTASALIQSTVSVLPTVAKAKKAMAAYSDEDAAEACFTAQFLKLFDAAGVTTEVTMGSFVPELDDKGSRKVIKGGDEFLGFAGSVRRSAGGAPQFFEVQAVLAREGRAVAQLVLVTTGSIPQDDAQDMLQTVVTRMGKA